MASDLWWLWVTLAFLVIAFFIWLFGRDKGGQGAQMAHPTQHEAEAQSAPTPEPIAIEASPEPDHATAQRGEEIPPAAADNLEIIEGIGPKIAGLLSQTGITTFAQLAQTEPERLVEILTAANLQRLANPGTWPRQAALAAEGKWDELTAYQQTLKAGRSG